MRLMSLTMFVLLVSACDRPPGEIGPDPASAPLETGPVPAALVGKWAADPAWCANDTGPERPVEITTSQFQGYENSCAVVAVTEDAEGFVAELRCQAEGQIVQERTRWQVSGQVLTQSWPDDTVSGSVQFTRCPVVVSGSGP